MSTLQSSVQPRYKRRMPCRMRVGESRYSGMVLNLSGSGLFIQTSASAEPGDAVQLELEGEIPVSAEVVWRRKVPASLRSMVEGGIGVRISNATEGYYRLLGAAAGKPAPAPAPAPAGEKFRARLKRCDGPRSRTLDVVAASLEEAEQKALARVGSGWTVLDIERRS